MKDRTTLLEVFTRLTPAFPNTSQSQIDILIDLVEPVHVIASLAITAHCRR